MKTPRLGGGVSVALSPDSFFISIFELRDIIIPWNFSSKIICEPNQENWDSELIRIKFDQTPFNREILNSHLNYFSTLLVNQCYKNFTQFKKFKC